MAQQQAAQESFDTYVREVAGGGAAQELEKAAALLAAGTISQDEFDRLKEKILA